MIRLKQNPILLISSIVSLVLGLWLLTTDYNEILGMIYFLIGGGLILTGISKLYLKNKSNEGSYLYDGAINIIVGVMIMFVHDLITTIILGVIFVLFPIIRICKSTSKKETFKRELPLLIIGLVIALSGDLIGNIFVKILGVLFILLAIYLFINIFTDKISFYKTRKIKKDKVVDSNNVIDVEYEE